MLSSRRIALRVFSRPCARTYNNDSYPRARPAPIPLPREDQREFEDLQRAAQQGTSDQHPDAREELKPDFEPGFQGNSVNPTTGEINGPKREPVGATVQCIATSCTKAIYTRKFGDVYKKEMN